MQCPDRRVFSRSFFLLFLFRNDNIISLNVIKVVMLMDAYFMDPSVVDAVRKTFAEKKIVRFIRAFGESIE